MESDLQRSFFLTNFKNRSFLNSTVLCFFIISGCSLEYALETATLHPARALGIDDRKGNLNFGSDADFVIMHPTTLKVLSTWIAGECVYKIESNGI